MHHKGNSKSAVNELNIEKVIEDKGYYDKYGEWNSVIRSRKYPGMLFRGRVEVFIFRDDCVYIELYNDGSYRIPGGSFDIRRSNHDQVYNEAKEEARLIIHNIRYTGYSYHKLKQKPYVSKDNKTIAWNGTYNKIYTADLSGYYSGKVNIHSQDVSMYRHGRFVPLTQVYNILSEDHKLALQEKIKTLGMVL